MARFLLRDGGYAVRALTRNVNNEKAQAFKSQGAEVIACDIGNEAQVTAAFQGAYAVFGLTNYWEHGAEAEVKQGKNLANAAKKCGIKHFIWSSLPHVPGIEPGHWESKVAVEKYCYEIGLPISVVTTPSYFENMWMFYPLKRLPDGSLLADYFFPTELIFPSFAAEDLGGWVLAILKNPEAWLGKKLGLCVGQYTARDYVTAMSEALGEKITLKEVTVEQFEANRAQVHHDLWLNLKAFWDVPDLWAKDIEQTLRVYPEAQDLKKFMDTHKQQLLDGVVPA